MRSLFTKTGKEFCRLASTTLLLVLLAGAVLPCASDVEASGTKTLGDLAIGDKVVDPSWQWEFRAGFNNSLPIIDIKPVVWIIVAKDHYGPESGVTLLSEELIAMYTFDNSRNRGSYNGSNHWGNSGEEDATNGLRPWLNSTGIYNREGFFNAFSESFKSIVITTTLPNKLFDTGFAYNTRDKVFIPSTTELGDTEHINTYPIGTVYQFFSGAGNADRTAYLGGVYSLNYWTRSPIAEEHRSYIVNRVSTSGGFDTVTAKFAFSGVRPALNVKPDILVFGVSNKDGIYRILFEPTFTDVRFDMQFFPNIEAIYGEGITTGYPDGTYRPNEPVTRGQMAAFLSRALELEDPEVTEPTFTDVTIDMQFFSNIEAIYGEGITTGYPDGTYRPNDPVTRGQMAAFLSRALELENPGVTEPTFTDVTIDMQFFPNIEAIYAEGITNGYPDGTYRPNDPVTRGQMAAFISRAFGLAD